MMKCVKTRDPLWLQVGFLLKVRALRFAFCALPVQQVLGERCRLRW